MSEPTPGRTGRTDGAVEVTPEEMRELLGCALDLARRERDEARAEVERMRAEPLAARLAKDAGDQRLRAVTAERDRDDARAQRDRLAETLREILTHPEHMGGLRGPYAYLVRWRAALDAVAHDHPAPGELPAWVFNLVRGLIRYEAEHPKLYAQYAGSDDYEPAECAAALLRLVPAEVVAALGPEQPVVPTTQPDPHVHGAPTNPRRD